MSTRRPDTTPVAIASPVTGAKRTTGLLSDGRGRPLAERLWADDVTYPPTRRAASTRPDCRDGATVRPMGVALGLRSGEGGSACIVVNADGGGVRVLARRPVALADPDWTLAPFHAATAQPDRADEIIDGAITFVGARAKAIVGEVIASLGELVSIGVVLGNAPPPSRAHALRSHVASHAAEGWLLRTALLDAATDTGVPVFATAERDVLPSLSAAWRTDADALLTGLKLSGGAPWRKPEKLAAAVAILSLGSPP